MYRLLAFCCILEGSASIVTLFNFSPLVGLVAMALAFFLLIQAWRTHVN